MKIGFDAKRVFNNFTGLGNYSRFVVDALENHYPDNQYFLFTPKLNSNKEVESYFNKPSVTIIQPKGWQRQLKAQAYWRTYGIAKNITESKIQIYHGLSNELPRVLPATVKRVVTIHDLIFIRYPEYYNRVDTWIYKKKVLHACKMADAVIAISQQTANDLVELLGIDREKISVVYQGCHQNFKVATNRQAQLRATSKYQLPARFILFVGTIEPRKNSGLIIEALSLIDEDIELVLVGRMTSYTQHLEYKATKMGLRNRIHFQHNVSFDDLPYIYQQAELFVYPSFYEGFGIPLIEAIASGVPVITSKGSCFAEAAGPQALYVDPHDSGALAESINMVLSYPEKRRQMVEQSKIYIEKFSPEVIASELMDLYKQVLAK